MTCFRRGNIAPGAGKIPTAGKSYIQKDLIYNVSNQGVPPDQISVAPREWVTARQPGTILNSGVSCSDGVAVDTVNAYKWTFGQTAYTQATGSLQPIFRQNQWGNSVPSIVSDGIDDVLVGNGSANGMTSNISSIVTILFGGYISYGAGDGYVSFHSTGGGSGRCTFGGGSTGTRKEADRALDADSVSTITSSGTYPTGLEVMIYIIDFTNKRGRIIRNGTEILAYSTLTNQTAGNTSATNSTTSQIFAANSSLYSNYALTDMVKYVNSIPNDSELIDITRYYSNIGSLGLII